MRIKLNYFVFFTCFICFGVLQVTAQTNQRFENITKKEQNKITEIQELLTTDIDSAYTEIENFQKGINSESQLNLKIEFLTLQFELFKAKGDFIHAKLTFYEALSWRSKIKNNYYYLLITYLEGMNEGIKKNIKKQKEILQSVRNQSIDKKYKNLIAKSSLALGKIHSNNGDFINSQKQLEIASKIFLKSKDIKQYIACKTNQGITYYWEENYPKSIQLFHETRSYYLENNYQKSYANSILNLGEAYLYMDGGLDSAKYYFKEFLKIKKSAELRDVFNCYYSLEEYFNRINKQDSAYFYLQKAYDVDIKIKDLMQEKTSQEIDLLYKKLERQRKIENEHKEEANLKTILILSLVFLFLVLLVFYFLLRQKNKLNAKLVLQNIEIKHKNKIIDQSLKDKELLLKEIHHRVKNNLQIISSLLSLQVKNTEDKFAIEALNEGKERIQAIALIHQKLYVQGTFASVHLNEYLSELLEQIRVSFQKEKIEVVYKTNDINLSLDTIVPLGLIICELTTNAFKYAFPDDKNGSIKVEINHSDKDFYILNLKDDGVGMPNDFNYLKSKTLGVEIITALTEQLDGEISYKSDENGTSIKLKFKEVK